MKENIDIIEPRNIAMPKGGGSIGSLGETFKANSFLGSGSYSIPIDLPSSREFFPDISVNYSLGNGNSSFGLGFSLSLPKVTISRKKRLPKYDNTDIYLVNDQEVVLKNKEAYIEGGYTVYEYIPRIISSFDTIKYYKKDDTSFWKIIDSQNTTTVYGQSESSKVYDKKNPSKIYEWLIQSMEDSKGNRANFIYKEENDDGIKSLVYEKDRACNQKYIQKIEYGNYLKEEETKYAFHILFDYGEYDLNDLEKNSNNPYTNLKQWNYREDAFSSYESCFEIRTRRRCENILVFNNFEKELGDISLVKRLNFNYSYTKHSNISTLDNVIGYGYKRQGKKADDSYLIQNLPPLAFKFSSFNPNSKPSFKELSIENSSNIPGYLSADGFQTIDLYEEGISGLLYSNDQTLMYCEPLGNGNYKKPALVKEFPIDKDLQNQTLSLEDLQGDGELELVVKDEIRHGYYKRVQKDNKTTWEDYNSFESFPNYFSNPNLEAVSLSNNGKSDLVQINSSNTAFYSSLGLKGYEALKKVNQNVNLAYKKESYNQKEVTFSSFIGDGLSHRIKITKNSVEFWPNLGYGNFGEKVLLDVNFDLGKDFDTSRLYLADIDGSGTVDIIYINSTGATIYINQNGNTFSKPINITFPEKFSRIDQISFADILGNGTSCLVFTKITPSPKHYYYNFVGEVDIEGNISVIKPYLLNEIDNNIGGASQLYYTSSTSFYLEDKAKNRVWNTRLPFPVQVVKKVVSLDYITKSRFSSEYAYHDGFYDHKEKEFKGFAFVETWDSEDYDTYLKYKEKSEYQNDSFSSPVYTKAWFETGNKNQINYDNNKNLPSSYFKGDEKAYLMPSNIIPPSKDEKTSHQSYSTLAGSSIRTEIYGYKNQELIPTPYSVESSNYKVEIYQEILDNPYAVFTLNSRESISYDYETNKDDPRISQSFLLKSDKYTNPLIQCSISLPRRELEDTKIYREQQELRVLVSKNSFVKPLQNDLFCHSSWESKTFELINAQITVDGYFSFEEISKEIEQSFNKIIAYGEHFDGDELALKELSWNKTIFWDEELKETLPEEEINSHGLIHHFKEAVFTSEFIENISKYMDNDLLANKAGYIYDEQNNYWWNNGLVQYYDETSFYLPSKTQNSFVTNSSSLYSKMEVFYDEYKLYTLKTSQYINESTNLEICGDIDYMIGNYKNLTDENNNQSQFLYDPLGNVYVTSLVGKIDDKEKGGIDLENYIPQKVENLENIISEPMKYLQGATSFFYYDLDNYQNTKEANSSITLIRDEFYHIEENSSCKMQIVYTDGSSNEVETRVKYDDIKWSVSGKSVFNNKGNIVKEYLPYFSEFYLFSKGDISLDTIAPTSFIYDPLDRIIQTNTPKGFFTKTVFTPWEQNYYDENDTLLDAPYYQKFMQEYPQNPSIEQEAEYKALQKASKFYDTPTIERFDSLGNSFLQIQTKKEDEELIELCTYSSFDILGRTLESIDPRLYESNQKNDTKYFNFRYIYTMNSDSPIYTNSIDGGEQMLLNNIYSNPIFSLDAREYCKYITYSNTQNQKELFIKNITDEVKIDYDSFDLLEIYKYGETLEDKDKNLFGKLIQMNDPSGIIQNTLYSISGEVLTSSKQLIKEYKKAIDWKETPILEDQIFKGSYSFNALGAIKSEEKNGFSTNYTYNSAGELYSIKASKDDSFEQEIIKSISYDAKGNRVSVEYGNKKTTNYNYEDSSLNLISIKTSNIQNLIYTYDPVGNITQCQNQVDEIIYNKNQEVKPISEYTYNSLYELIEAKGRQHPAVNAKTSKEELCKALSLNDQEVLENYIQRYEYDNSGNLISKVHTADSNPYTTHTKVQENSNRLAELEYDKGGNQLQLSKDGTKELKYDAFNNLSLVNIIQREENLDDTEYYIYDSTQHRVKKVSSNYQDNTNINNINEKIYIQNYEQNKTKQIKDGTEEIIEEKESLRVMDGDTCVAIIYNFIKVKKGKDIEENTPLIKYQLANNIDSITIELNEEGEILTYEEYYPFGQTSYMYGKSKLYCELKSYRYSAKEKDELTGLYYYGRRYYNPSLSRWINTDPAGTIDGLNIFAFLRGNPINGVDIDGLVKVYSYTRTGKIGSKKRINEAKKIKKEKEERGKSIKKTLSIELRENFLKLLEKIKKSQFKESQTIEIDKGPKIKFHKGKYASELHISSKGLFRSKKKGKNHLPEYNSLYKLLRKEHTNGVKNDSEVAQALLDRDFSKFTEKGKYAAKTLFNIVGYAEEFRKAGASEEFETFLKTVAENKRTFRSFEDFVASQKGGARKMRKLLSQKKDRTQSPRAERNLKKRFFKNRDKHLK